ncbi:MAG: serine/threonine protein kinase [Nannocystaceae bacterium]|nr:serine/threonine protein kinase [Nannocystaceae bacterium]
MSDDDNASDKDVDAHTATQVAGTDDHSEPAADTDPAARAKTSNDGMAAKPPGADADTDLAARPSPPKPDPVRSPSQMELHADVRDALFGDCGRLASGSRDEYEPGTMLVGRYRIVSLLGRGGMGVVYRAHDLVLGEDVAIKLLPRRLAAKPELIRRFVNEVRIARQITHASVCRVHDIGEADGRQFLSMEFIDGEDLASLLRRIGRLPLEKAMQLAQQLCAGLAALHDKGLLHRDLKPANLMIDGRGRLKIADFGLAVLADDVTELEIRDGTPAYQAPEQAEGAEVTVRSEVFALGLVLHELVTGAHPFQSRVHGASTTTDMTPLDAPSRISGLPREIEDVINACLERNPEDRPTSVLEVAAALPGGDPVAAAIAAGLAPSVNAVANIGAHGGIKPWIAWVCAAWIAVATLALASVAPIITALGQTEPKLSPPVLLHQTQALLAEAGIEGPVGDWWQDLEYEKQYFREGAVGADDWETRRLESDGPAPILFRYRQHPGLLLPSSAGVSINDPAVKAPGELRATLDGRGLLRELWIVPPAATVEPAGDYDWRVLLRATGLDPETAKPAEPNRTPPFHSDTVQAWTGEVAATGTQIRVEVASLGGRPVSLLAVRPWTPDPTTSEMLNEQSESRWGTSALIVVVFAVVFTLARRSVLRREADLAGAARVTASVVIVLFVSGILSSHHAGPMAELMLWFDLGTKACGAGVIFALCYVIVEPQGRRYLPGAMVSWTRLVTGRWRDRLVARDVLFGAAFGVGFMLWARLNLWMISGGPRPSYRSLSVLLSSRHAIGGLAQVCSSAVFGVLQLFVLFLLIRMVFRGPKRAWVAFVVLWATTSIFWTEPHIPTLVASVVGGLISSATLVVVVTRFGLLTTVVLQLVLNLLSTYPVTINAGAWYGSTGVMGFLGVGALVLFGLRAARPALATTAASSSATN